MGKSYGSNLEQPYEGSESDISTSKDYVDLQGNVPPFEYQVILDIRERKTALKTLAKQLQITSGDPEYGTLKDQILQLGVVPKALEGDATYDIGEARTWYGLSEYVPPVESPDPGEGNELGESAPHEITWQKPRNENGGESDPKQKPGHIRLTNNEFKNELTLGKGDKESSRDPSTYIIPTFGRLLGIPEGDDKGALEYKLRLAIEANDKNIPEELQWGELTPENRAVWREQIGLETLSAEQTEQTEVIDTEIQARIQAYPYLEHTKLATTDDYTRARNYLSDWLLIADDLERDNLVRGIQATGIMPKLTDLPKYELIKAQQKNADISGEYLEFINATRALYGLSAYGGTSGELTPGVVVEEHSVSTEILNEQGSDDGFDIRGEGKTLEVPPEQDLRQDESVSTTETNPSGLDPETETLLDGLPGAEELARELGDLTNSIAERETGGALARIEGEISPGEGELETLDKSAEIEQLKQESLQAIATYQQFAQEHPFHTRDLATNERYRAFEQAAWEAQNKLAHIKGGEIFALPQQRDIDLSHPEAKNTKDYLEAQGYGFDENGNIITIKHHSKNIELNRTYSVANLIGKARPAHILTDINLDAVDSDLHYTGYVLPGLNPQTPDFIVSTLSKNEFIKGVIVDDTNIPLSTLSGSEAVGYKSIPDFEKNVDSSYKINITDLRTAYARAEELYNRNRNDESAKLELERLRGEYNQTVEEVIGIMAAQGLESEIHRVFTQEVKNLRDSRIDQSQELQGKWEKRFNGAKEKFLGWATKNKTRWMLANIGLFAAGALLSSTGAGIPVSGALEMTRRSLGSVMSGVSSRNTLVGLMEDGEINRFGIKFKAVIPKLVEDSLKDDYINNANDADLSTKLSTLEAYYRLNGGKFTNESQQTAYEAILTELGSRVQRESIAKQVKQESSSTNTLKAKDEIISSEDITNEVAIQGASEKFVFSSPEQNQQYTSRLLTTLSEKRITELQKQQRNRTIANVVGTAVGGGLMTSLAVDMMRPGGVFNPEQVAATSKPEVEPISPTPEGTGAATEATKAATQNLSPEQLQDISQLSKGETLWGKVAEKLGAGASEAQIQQAVENYLQSQSGQDTIFKLANQTEGGRGLLAQWGIDNANEMASLSKEQLYEVSKYLGEGKLDGITELSLDNLDALEQAEYLAPSPTEAPTIDPGYSETPASSPVGTESLGSEPSVPPTAEAPVAAPAPEVPPVATSEFTRDLSEILGKQNLTDLQAKEIIQSYFTDDYGREVIYNSIINTGEGSTFLSNGFGVNSLNDFANLSPEQMSEVVNNINSDELRKVLNQTILARFEDAPDMVELTKGTNSLGVVQRYIANELGNLPYDSNLGKQVLDTYVQTDAGKQWLYDSIVNNPDINNQNIQYFKEYLRFKDIKSPEEFVSKFNWAEFSGNRNIPTSGFWNQIRLPNGGTRLQPLSTFLQPSKMIGIKEAVRQVLNK